MKKEKKKKKKERQILTWFIVRCKWIVEDCSQWTLTISAPAFMKSGTLWSGSTIICNGRLKLNISKSIFVPIDLKQFYHMKNKKYQMHIQWKICDRAQGINYKGSNSYIWNKSTIHHIYMNPVAACLLNCFHLNAWKAQE